MNSEPDAPSDAQARLLEYAPERCHSCPVLGELALMYAMLETKQALRGSDARRIARVFGCRTGNMCPDGVNEDGACRSRTESPFRAGRRVSAPEPTDQG